MSFVRLSYYTGWRFVVQSLQFKTEFFSDVFVSIEEIVPFDSRLSSLKMDVERICEEVFPTKEQAVIELTGLLGFLRERLADCELEINDTLLPSQITKKIDEIAQDVLCRHPSFVYTDPCKVAAATPRVVAAAAAPSGHESCGADDFYRQVRLRFPKGVEELHDCTRSLDMLFRSALETSEIDTPLERDAMHIIAQHLGPCVEALRKLEKEARDRIASLTLSLPSSSAPADLVNFKL